MRHLILLTTSITCVIGKYDKNIEEEKSMLNWLADSLSAIVEWRSPHFLLPDCAALFFVSQMLPYPKHTPVAGLCSREAPLRAYKHPLFEDTFRNAGSARAFGVWPKSSPGVTFISIYAPWRLPDSLPPLPLCD